MSPRKRQYEEREVVAASAEKEPMLTLEAYCAAKRIPERNRPGMKTFAKSTTRATLLEWERIFASY